MANPSNVKLLVKMNLIKSVNTYIVSETILTVEGITVVQQRALSATLKGISLTGAK